MTPLLKGRNEIELPYKKCFLYDYLNIVCHECHLLIAGIFLSNEKVSEKNLMVMDIDIDSTLHVADEVTDFLDVNVKNPFERYVVARLISILYEEKWNFSLDPKFETEVRNIAKENPEVSG